MHLLFCIKRWLLNHIISDDGKITLHTQTCHCSGKLNPVRKCQPKSNKKINLHIAMNKACYFCWNNIDLVHVTMKKTLLSQYLKQIYHRDVPKDQYHQNKTSCIHTLKQLTQYKNCYSIFNIDSLVKCYLYLSKLQHALKSRI